MSRWRRYQSQARTAVLCDQLAEAGVWPFRRFVWRPDLRPRGFETLVIRTFSGPVQIRPSPMVGSGTFLVFTDAPPLGDVITHSNRPTLNSINSALDLAGRTATPLIVQVSPRDYAALNEQVADMRMFDVSQRHTPAAIADFHAALALQDQINARPRAPVGLAQLVDLGVRAGFLTSPEEILEVLDLPPEP